MTSPAIKFFELLFGVAKANTVMMRVDFVKRELRKPGKRGCQLN